ncbi:MAG: C4-type zinc ribbon domain-containing protein [Nocardioidaceae bacterium]
MLDVQTLDARIDQLNHLLVALPEAIALRETTERLIDVGAVHGRARTDVDDLAREQRKADADVEQVKARKERNRQRIDAGQVSDPKQLQAMEHETRSLDKRIADLEDAELEVMERLELAQSELARLGAELEQLETQQAEQTEGRDRAAGEVAEQLAESAAEREMLAEQIPADLRALYEKLRAHLGGVGAGPLHHRRCGGCQLNVGAAELARMANAPSDEVLRCEECSRILVRTAESGI